MKNILLIVLIGFLTINAKSQSKDYCASLTKPSVPQLAVCLDSKMSFYMGTEISKKISYKEFAPRYKWLTEDDEFALHDSCFVIVESEGEWKDMTRTSIQISNNLSVHIAIIPYTEKGDEDYARIVILAKTSGETHSLSDGNFIKTKMSSTSNKLRYVVQPKCNTILIGDKNFTPEISFVLDDGRILKSIIIGDLMVVI